MSFRYMILLIFFLINILSAADSPEKVYRITYVQKSDEWYKEQAILWQKMLQRDKFDEQAWMNYYYANRYANFDEKTHVDKTKQERLDNILAEMKKYIQDTYTYHYIKALNATHINEINVESLEYAHKRWPEHADVLYELILYYEVKGNRDKVNRYARELYASEDIARGLIEYNANMILSAEPGSILFTNGDNDTYPALVIQKVHSFHEDILVINLHLAFAYRDYLTELLDKHDVQIDVRKFSQEDMKSFFSELVHSINKKYPQKKLYMSTTLNSEFIDLFEENLYLVGLVYQYNRNRMDNLSVLRENIQKKLRLDYLFNDWYNEKYPATPFVDNLNQNYIVIFMNLAEYLAKEGEKELARFYRDRASKLANKSNNQKMIQKIREFQI